MSAIAYPACQLDYLQRYACCYIVPPSVLSVSPIRLNVQNHGVAAAALIASVLKIILFNDALPGDTHRVSWHEFLGIVTGRAAAVYLGMLLLVIARRSILSDRHGLEYTKTIAFHRTAGWWIVALSLIHSFVFSWEYFQAGGWYELLKACVPISLTCDDQDADEHCWNTLGLVNGFGVVASLIVIILGVFSQEYVRRRFYNLFYFTHVTAAAIFMLFCGLHDFPMVLIMLPGLALYFKDRVLAFECRINAPETTAEIVCRNDASSVVLLSWCAASNIRLLPGARWVYLREPSISSVQWHPYSVIQHKSRAYVLVKAAGDWSESLCSLVTSGQPVQLRIDGPYGMPFTDEKKSLQPRALILFAGGVGISPFIDLLCGLHTLGDNKWKKITLVWTVRSNEYSGLAAALDLRSLSQKADIKVFITSQDIIETGIEVHNRIGSTWDSGAHKPEHDWHKALILLSCVLIATGVTASDIVHSWTNKAHVSSLMEYTLIHRAAPIVLALFIALLISLGLILIPKTVRHTKDQAEHSGTECCREWQERSVGTDSVSDTNPSIQYRKPDLQEIFEQAAELEPLEVKICGPGRMLSSLTQTARLLQRRGFDILLDTLESRL